MKTNEYHIQNLLQITTKVHAHTPRMVRDNPFRRTGEKNTNKTGENDLRKVSYSSK